MFWIIGKIPTWLSGPLILLLVTLNYIWKKLTRSLLGVFICSIIAYWYTKNYTEIAPYTFDELITWFTLLDINSKTAITTSLITVIGFLVAFHTATMNWKQHLDAQNSLLAAGELDGNSVAVTSLLTDIGHYCRGIIAAYNLAQQDPTSAEIKFRIEYEYKRLPEFQANRDKLLSLVTSGLFIVSKYSIQFSNVPKGAVHVEMYNAMGLAICDAMWVRVPTLFDGDPRLIDNFISQINVDEYKVLENLCSTNGAKMSGLAGMVCGQLQSVITEPNINTILQFFRNRKKMEDRIRQVFYRGGRN